MNYSGNQLILLIDNNQFIKKIVLNTIKGLDIDPNTPVLKIFKSNQQSKFLNMLKNINQTGFNLGTKFLLHSGEEVFVFYLKLETETIIFIIGFDEEFNLIFDEIMKLNNRQINEIRNLKKQLSSTKTETDFLEETMKLNSELVNIRRELSIKNRELEVINNTDYLTKINNRRKFFSDIYQLVKHDEYYLIMMDIDNFKLINDELGHQIGDETLILIAKELRLRLEKLDGKIYRIGGDEFAALIKVENMIDFEKIASDINDILKNIHPKSGVSYGIKKVDSQANSINLMVENSMVDADKQMYNMKKLK